MLLFCCLYEMKYENKFDSRIVTPIWFQLTETHQTLPEELDLLPKAATSLNMHETFKWVQLRRCPFDRSCGSYLG